MRPCTLLSLCFLLGLNAQALAQGETSQAKAIYEDVGRKFGDIGEVVNSGGQSNQLGNMGVNLAGIPSRSPVAIVTNLDTSDLDVAEGVQLDITRASLGYESIRAFCERAKGTSLETPPILITDRPLKFDLPLMQACSKGNAWGGDSQPVVYAIPFAVRAAIVVVRDNDQFPDWITPTHFTVAALQSTLSGSATFGPKELSIRLPECSEKPVQPSPESLQQELQIAECVITDASGRRKVGYRFRSAVADPRLTHGTYSEQNFGSFNFDRMTAGPQKDWSHIDYGLKGMPIRLLVLDDPKGNELIELFCRKLPNFEESYLQRRPETLQFLTQNCKWRGDAAFSDTLLRPDQLSSGVAMYANLAYFIRNLKDKRGSDGRIADIDSYFVPALSSSALKSAIKPAERWSSLFDNVLRGRYALADYFWMYVNPASFKNRSAAAFIEAALKKGAKSGYRGRLALFADLGLVMKAW